jgi:hypothetical protein
MATPLKKPTHETSVPEGAQDHFLDLCALILVGHADKEWAEQKEQTFPCHFECFRKLVADDSLMYIADPDFSTNGEAD